MPRDPDTTDSEPRTTINGFSLIIGTKVKTRTAADREEFSGNEQRADKGIRRPVNVRCDWEKGMRLKIGLEI